MWYGIITLGIFFIVLLTTLIKTRFTCDLTDRILKNELKRRSSIRNKHKLMRIKGVTIK